MADYLLSIDQGTTSSRAILFNHQGDVVASEQQEFDQHFPHDGWVEHEPNDLWQSVLNCSQQVIGQLKTGDNVCAIGITNQRETTLVWDRKTGKTVYRAIVWQDRRTHHHCQQLKADGHEAMIKQRTGLLLDPYFSATKLRWILDEVPGVRARAERGELAFGTVDSYLLWQLSQGKEHRTDATNASRTLLFNIHTQQWDEELLALFDIPASLLPEVMDSADDFGYCSADLFSRRIPVLAMAGDQQAALIGQCCFDTGSAKATYGTGCFMMTNTGASALESNNQLLTTVAYRLNGDTSYAIEGSIFVAGAAIQWLRDGLHIISRADQSEALARQTADDHGVYMIPAFTGLGAPYWDPEARGAILGLSRDSGIKEIVTAALESVCFQTQDLQTAMQNDGQRLLSLRVDGGMAANDWLLQTLANTLGTTIDRPIMTETTALGVAYLAALKAGIYSSLEEVAEQWQCQQRFEPKIEKAARDRRYAGWQQAVNRVKSQ